MKNARLGKKELSKLPRLMLIVATWACVLTVAVMVVGLAWEALREHQSDILQQSLDERKERWNSEYFLVNSLGLRQEEVEEMSDSELKFRYEAAVLREDAKRQQGNR